MGRRIARIAKFELARSARDHVEHTVGHILLHAQAVAAPNNADRRSGNADVNHIIGYLFRQRGGIDDHGIDAAGFSDQRHDRPIFGG